MRCVSLMAPMMALTVRPRLSASCAFTETDEGLRMVLVFPLPQRVKSVEPVIVSCSGKVPEPMQRTEPGVPERFAIAFWIASWEGFSELTVAEQVGAPR